MAQHMNKTEPENADAIRILLSSSSRARQDHLLDGRLIVQTPYGLKPQDRMLIEAAEAIPATRMMTLAMQDVLPALALAALRPHAEMLFYHFDLFPVRQAESLAGAHRFLNLKGLCAAELPALAEPPELVVAEFRTDSEAGLTLELLRQAHAGLALGGKLLVVINNPRDQWLRHQLEKIFGNLTQVTRDKHSIVYSAKRTSRPAASGETGAPEAPSRFIKHVEVNFQPWVLDFETCYGTFSSDGLDEGSRALLDVLAPPESCQSILDLGCGWGGMGVLAAKKSGATRLVMIDSNARAVDLAQRNAERLGIAEAEVHLESDVESIQAGMQNGQFDLVISNPPYATEFRVLDLFITMAWRALRPGGQVWLVGKNNPHMIQKAEDVFGNAEVFRRRGYQIVKAERPDTRRY